MQKFFFFSFMLCCLNSYAQKEFRLDTFNLNVNSNFRGVSVVDDEVIWISGSNGYVGKSTDGGKKFKMYRVPNYEKLDFRDIEAFDDENAVILNSGTPALFLRTSDGGASWKTVYKNDRKELFFDGMDFWDKKKGLAFSDPVNGKLFLLKTEDGGNKWKEIPVKDCPQIQDGEAGFAASGTSIRVTGSGSAFIGTGGKAAHLFFSENYGETWKKFSCPIVKFKESTGIFSIAFKDARTGVVMGGDYRADTASADNCFLTYSGGKAWHAPNKPPLGYRSCVEYISETNLITTGTTGTDISHDGGLTWKKFSATGFNVVRKAKKGNKIFLAGNNGCVGVLEIRK